MGTIQTTSLHFHYKEGPTFHYPDWIVETGQHWLVTGPSGCGKTTLLHLLSGLHKPTSGRVSIAGTDLGGLSGTRCDTFRGLHIGMIFQRHFFMSSLTMMGNLKLAQTLPGNPPDFEKITSVAAELDISDHLLKKPAQLSQGELQRFSIARAVINHPKIILADEPTSSLDDLNCTRFIDLLVQTTDKFGSTLVIATHDSRLTSLIANRLELL